MARLCENSQHYPDFLQHSTPSSVRSNNTTVNYQALAQKGTI